MKALIDKGGFLEIERHGKMSKQGCYRDASNAKNGLFRCGDWCPAFREPEEQRGWKADGSVNYPRYVLSLCNTVGDLFFDEIEDNRGTR